MQIQTYEVEEISGELGVMAADSESAELIEKLDLGGQRGFLNPETVTRFPYRKMTEVEHRVFRLLFPERTKLEKYAGGIIPLRVLQVAAHAKENAPADMKAGLYVWHTKSAKEDPLLVGHSSEYGGEFYLLARWGDALPDFESLIAKAKAAWIAKAKLKANSEISGWQRDLTNLGHIADEIFSSGKLTHDQATNSYELGNL